MPVEGGFEEPEAGAPTRADDREPVVRWPEPSALDDWWTAVMAGEPVSGIARRSTRVIRPPRTVAG